MKSYRPRDGSGEPPAAGRRNQALDLQGQQRRCDIHVSVTAPEAWLYKKAAGRTAKLCTGERLPPFAHHCLHCAEEG